MKIARIVVGLEPARRSRATLAAAARIAARMEAELVGVFVEDADLLHLAGMPFAREVGYPSAAERALDTSIMERSMRALADETRRALAAIAEPALLRWSFRVARGSIASELLAGAGETDLILLLQEGAPAIAICSSAVAAAAVVKAASALIGSSGSRLGIVLLADDAQVFAQWESEASRLFAAHSGGAWVRIVRVAEPAALRSKLSELRREAAGPARSADVRPADA